MATLARAEGDYNRARDLFEQRLAICREMSDKQSLGWTLGKLGSLAGLQGDHHRGQALLDESLALFREIGDISGLSNYVYSSGMLAIYQGEYARGVQLISSILDEWCLALDPDEQAECKAMLARAESALGEVAFRRITSEARAMGLKQAISEA